MKFPLPSDQHPVLSRSWLRRMAPPAVAAATLLIAAPELTMGQTGWKWFQRPEPVAPQPPRPQNGFGVTVQKLLDQARVHANAGRFDEAMSCAQRAHKIAEAASGVLGEDPACSPAVTQKFMQDLTALAAVSANPLPSGSLAGQNPGLSRQLAGKSPAPAAAAPATASPAVVQAAVPRAVAGLTAPPVAKLPASPYHPTPVAAIPQVAPPAAVSPQPASAPPAAVANAPAHSALQSSSPSPQRQEWLNYLKGTPLPAVRAANTAVAGTHSKSSAVNESAAVPSTAVAAAAPVPAPVAPVRPAVATPAPAKAATPAAVVSQHVATAPAQPEATHSVAVQAVSAPAVTAQIVSAPEPAPQPVRNEPFIGLSEFAILGGDPSAEVVLQLRPDAQDEWSAEPFWTGKPENSLFADAQAIFPDHSVTTSVEPESVWLPYGGTRPTDASRQTVSEVSAPMAVTTPAPEVAASGEKPAQQSPAQIVESRPEPPTVIPQQPAPVATATTAALPQADDVVLAPFFDTLFQIHEKETLVSSGPGLVTGSLPVTELAEVDTPARLADGQAESSGLRPAEAAIFEVDTALLETRPGSGEPSLPASGLTGQSVPPARLTTPQATTETPVPTEWSSAAPGQAPRQKRPTTPESNSPWRPAAASQVPAAESSQDSVQFVAPLKGNPGEMAAPTIRTQSQSLQLANDAAVAGDANFAVIPESSGEIVTTSLRVFAGSTQASTSATAVADPGRGERVDPAVGDVSDVVDYVAGRPVVWQQTMAGSLELPQATDDATKATLRHQQQQKLLFGGAGLLLFGCGLFLFRSSRRPTNPDSPAGNDSSPAS